MGAWIGALVLAAGAADAERGKAVYLQRCAQCHGLEGAADGPAAERVFPRPRNFTGGTYKLRSTPSGSLPTDEDMFRTITHGMPGTSMPAWGMLSEEDRRALVAHLKTFSSRFKDEAAPKPVELGPMPSETPEGVAQGKKLYKDLGCANCHGASGRGNGPSVYADEEGKLVPALLDEWEHPVFPANFTKRWTLRRGASVSDIRLAFATGIGGTPMPAFHGPEVFPVDEKASDDAKAKQAHEQAWRLAQYIASLGPEHPRLGAVLAAAPLAELGGPGSARGAAAAAAALPADASDKAWERAVPLDLPLAGQIVMEPRQFTPSLDLVTVRALYAAGEMAWLVEWDDRTADAGDRLVLQFPLKAEAGAAKPYFLGGDARRPVEWWVISPQAGKGTARLCAGWPSDLEKPGKPAGATLAVSAVYDDGRWRAVIRRPLAPGGDHQGAAFQPGTFHPFAVFAWDGTQGEAGARCAVSTWYNLRFEEPLPFTLFVYPPAIAVLVLLGEWWLIRALRRSA